MADTRNGFGLSVLLVTYNHSEHIIKALNGLFDQQLDFEIQLVVADDASSDNTLDLIRSYDGLDSRFHFLYLQNNKNLGITRNYQRGFNACLAPYVAILEGDDYWISPHKLRCQIDFLNEHKESDLCSVNYFVYEESRSDFYVRTPIEGDYKLLTARDLIADNLVGNFSTCMYRKAALERLPEKLFSIKSYDWIVNICVARTSLIGFLCTPMSVYRLHSSGAWTQAPLTGKLEAQLEAIPLYDELTERVFHAEFEALNLRLRHSLARAELGLSFRRKNMNTAQWLRESLLYRPPRIVRLIWSFMRRKIKNYIVRLLRKIR